MLAKADCRTIYYKELYNLITCVLFTVLSFAQTRQYTEGFDVRVGVKAFTQRYKMVQNNCGVILKLNVNS